LTPPKWVIFASESLGSQWDDADEILLMDKILHQLRLVVYPIIYRVLTIPGGAGFLPSTILHLQIVSLISVPCQEGGEVIFTLNSFHRF